MGSYWHRCRATLPSTLTRVCEIRPADERPAIHHYNREVCAYFLSAFVPEKNRRAKIDMDLKQAPGAPWTTVPSGLELASLLDRLCEIFPAPWYEGLRIYGGTDDLDEGIAIAQDIMYGRIVDIPQSGKWFKTGPCLDHVLFSTCLGGLLRLNVMGTFQSRTQPLGRTQPLAIADSPIVVGTLTSLLKNIQNIST